MKMSVLTVYNINFNELQNAIIAKLLSRVKSLWELTDIIAPLNTTQAQVGERFPVLPNSDNTNNGY